MVEIEFNYQQKKTVIQANINDSFNTIINKFISKSKLDINDIYFLLNGKEIKKNEIIKDTMNESERNNKKMIILVYSINTNINNENTNIIESNDIICPICKEICKYKIKDHRIILYECKYGHMTDNIQVHEFNNTQNLDLSKIKCNKCESKCKSNTFKN